MVKIKKINYYLLFLLAAGGWLLVAAMAQSQTPELEITLTWSTNTYIPIDYTGKALPAKGSVIEVAANIDSKGINPQVLNFRWFIDGHLQKRESGDGKQVFKFPVKWLFTDRYFIRTEIRDSRENLLTTAYLTIKIVEPEIVILPTKRLSNRIKIEIPPLANSTIAFKKYQILNNQEIEWTAQPYFFNIKNIDELNYNWSFSGENVSEDNPENPNILTLKLGKLNKAIKRDTNLWVENKNDRLQRAKSSVEVNIVP